MQNTYIIADIHGNYEALIKCLESVNFNYKNDRLIQLGDVVDRGNDSFMVVETLLKIKNLIAIKGNHDEWWNGFLTLGGHETRISYLKHLNNGEFCFNNKLISLIPQSHKDFFKKQINYYIENNDCFVHGGFNRLSKINEQDYDYIYYWDRDLINIAYSNDQFGVLETKTDNNFRNIFLGHTPTQSYYSSLPLKLTNVWALDTGSDYKDGKLTIMNYYTKEYKQF